MVSQRFHRAATAATASISTFLLGGIKIASLMSWLDRHGQCVTYLKLSILPCIQIPQLPCQHLRHLELSCCCVCLGSASLVGLCPGLTHLSLDTCRLTIEVGHVAPLAALAGLKHLQHLNIAWTKPDGDDGHTDLDCAQLAHNSRLTHLSLPGLGVRLINEQLLVCSLPLLQELGLPCRASTAALAGVQHLQHLTCLRVSNTKPISADRTPGVAQAVSLMSLSVWSGSWEASLLAGLTRLNHLALCAVSLRSTGQGGFAGAAALLSSLAHLQQLEELELNRIDCEWPPASAAYSAITASSKLQMLVVSDCTLPAGVWQHVFPSARRLPALQVLITPSNGHTGQDHATAVLDKSCLEGLVRCCPSLQQLQVHVTPDSDLLPLAQLSALASLHIFGASAPSIRTLAAAVTGLQDLTLTSSTPDAIIRPAWLLPLTALTQLSRIAVEPINREVDSDADFDSDDEPDELEHGLDQMWFTERGGASRPAWLQLLMFCMRYSECQAVFVQQLEQLMVEQQQRIEHQQQRLTDQEQRLTPQQEQELVEAASEVAQLRQQMQELMQVLKAYPQSG